MSRIDSKLLSLAPLDLFVNDNKATIRRKKAYNTLLKATQHTLTLAMMSNTDKYKRYEELQNKLNRI